MAEAIKDIRKCTTPGCSNVTRSNRLRARDYPNLSVRMKGGTCVECYVPEQPPCSGCGCALRVSSVPAHRMPGSKARHAGGMCKECWLNAHPEKVVEKKPAPEPIEPVNPEKLAYTIKGLESFMNRRRARLGVAA